MQPKDVLDFWFVEHGPEDWFAGGAMFDDKCREKLAGAHQQAIRAELWTWRKTIEGRLAEIILLDQLSRQLNRASARAFASDTMALALAQEAVASGLDETLGQHERLFLYLPYQHAESRVIQKESLRLNSALPDFLSFAQEHHDIVERFGRFPMRNAALGRETTPEEKAYIAERDGKAY